MKCQSNAESFESGFKTTIDVETVEVEEDSWPEGPYCILESVGGREGFANYQGWTTAMWTFQNEGIHKCGYTQVVAFGDSAAV